MKRSLYTKLQELRSWGLLLLLLCIPLRLQAQAASEEMLPGEKLAYDLCKNVIYIDGAEGPGLGFIVGEKEEKLYMVTANHVVRSTQPGFEGGFSTVVTTFDTKQGTKIDRNAVLEREYKEEHDLAVLSAEKPADFQWKRRRMAHLHTIIQGVPLWFVGKDADQRCLVSPKPAEIIHSDLLDPRVGIVIENPVGAGLGSSGGLLVSEYGLVGMLRGEMRDSSRVFVSILAMDFIEQSLRKEWGYPFHVGLPATRYILAPVWRSAIVPGWGQYDRGHRLKGAIAFLGVIGLSAASYHAHQRQDHFDTKLLSENDPSFRGFYRDERDKWRRRRDFLIPIAVTAYVGNLVHALTTRPKVKRYKFSVMPQFDLYNDAVRLRFSADW